MAANADFKGMHLCSYANYFFLNLMIITLTCDFQFFDFMLSFIWTLFRHVHSIISIRLYDQSEHLINVL